MPAVRSVLVCEAQVPFVNGGAERLVRGLMTELRIRHLPVVEDGQLLGLVSIGDVVKMQHDRLTMENHYLKSYLQG